MAPVASPIDLRGQILENCEFTNDLRADISLVLTKEPLGNFRAFVLKAQNNRREPLLAESGATVHEALQKLLVKSAEAVQNHIAANGFDFVPSKDDSDSEFDSTSCHGQDAGSGYDSLSDNETISVASTAKAPTRSSRKRATSKPKSAPAKANTRKPRSHSRSRSRSRSRSSSRSSSSSSTSRDHSPSPENARWRGGAPPHPGYGMQVRPPHLHTGWRADAPPRPPFAMRMPVYLNTAMASGHYTGPPPPSFPPGGSPPTQTSTSPTSSANHLPSAPPPPPAAGPATHKLATPPPKALHDVRLLIRWRSHGEQRVLEQAPLSVRGITDLALGYLRRNWTTFTSPSSASTGYDMPIEQWVGTLRAYLRRVTVDGVGYDVSGYQGDDLAPLIRTGGTAPSSVPQFEIEVDSGPTGPPPPPPLTMMAGNPSLGLGQAQGPGQAGDRRPISLTRPPPQVTMIPAMFGRAPPQPHGRPSPDR